LAGCIVSLAWLGAPQAQVLPSLPTSGSSAAAEAPTSADVDALIKALEDPEARATLLQQLRAVRAAQPEASTPRPDAAQVDLVAATVIDEFASEFQKRTDSFFAIVADIGGPISATGRVARRPSRGR
jgi:hypothetical protein